MNNWLKAFILLAILGGIVALFVAPSSYLKGYWPGNKTVAGTQAGSGGGTVGGSRGGVATPAAPAARPILSAQGPGPASNASAGQYGPYPEAPPAGQYALAVPTPLPMAMPPAVMPYEPQPGLRPGETWPPVEGVRTLSPFKIEFPVPGSYGLLGEIFTLFRLMPLVFPNFPRLEWLGGVGPGMPGIGCTLVALLS